MSFSNGVLFSYSTPIAAFCDAPAGRRVVVLTTESHSVTTSSKHRMSAHDFHAATVLYAPFFPRADVSGGYYRLPADMPVRDWSLSDPHAGTYRESAENYAARAVAHLHRANLAHHESAFAESMRKVAQDRVPTWREGHECEAAQEAREYCAAFGLIVPEWATDVAAAVSLVKSQRARDALRERRASPAYIRAREKAAARREAIENLRGAKIRQMDRLDFRMIESARKDRESGLYHVRNAMKTATSFTRIRTLASEAARELRCNRRPLNEARAIAAERAAAFAARESELRAAHPDSRDLLRRFGFVLGTAFLESMRDHDHAREIGRAAKYHDDGVHALVAHLRADATLRDEAPALVRAHMEAANAQREAEMRARVARREAEMRARDAAMAAKYPTSDAALDAWRASGDMEGVRFYGVCAASDGSDVIRATDSELVTLRGARAPLREARAAFAFIARKVESGALPWSPSGACGAKAGAFALAGVDETGAARFGCHRFTWREMSALAAILDAQDAQEGR